MQDGEAASRYDTLARLTMEDAVVPGAEVHPFRETGSRTLRLHVLGADRTGERPGVVLLFHGGGWRVGSPLFVLPHADVFVGLGLAVVLAEYRVSHRDQSTIDDSVQDARAAASYVRANGEKLGVDEGRMVLAGSSAGAHLALMVAAADPGQCRGAVLWNTPCDLADVRPWLDRTSEDLGQLSPIVHVHSASCFPPLLMFHGTGDAVVPVSGAQRFAAAIGSAGGSVEFVRFEGGHGFERPEHDGGTAMEACREASRRFLTALHMLPPCAQTPLEGSEMHEISPE